MNYKEIFETIGISIPDIILPKKGLDLSKFSVVAVDQYAENNKYWDDVKKTVEGNISSLNLVLPENFFLRGDTDYDARINTAGRYLEAGDLVPYGKSFIRGFCITNSAVGTSKAAVPVNPIITSNASVIKSRILIFHALIYTRRNQ